MEKSQISSDLIRGHIDTIILYSLLDGDKFAQQISDHVKLKSGENYELNQATLYSSLKRLENLKYVNAYWNDSESGRRRFFSLTELGKTIVNDNLNNWTFSRAIIDKLMDIQPEGVVKTEVVEVEKIVKVPEIVEVPVYVEKTIEKIIEPEQNTQNNLIENNSIPCESVKTENFEKAPSLVEEQQEINFRSILSGLIKATAKPTKKEKTNQSLDNEKIDNNENDEVLKFNETISTTTVAEHDAPTNYGKIDFSDLSLKAAKEGYKLRVSTKDARVVEGSVYINKVRFFTSLSVFLLVLLEVLLFSSAFKGEISTVLLIIAPILAVILPVVSAYFFFKQPLKTSAPIKADIILNSLIVFFNLLLITFALNLLFTVNFEDSFSLISFFIFPMVLYLDVFLYFVLKYCFGKLNFFLSKKKK